MAERIIISRAEKEAVRSKNRGILRPPLTDVTRPEVIIGKLTERMGSGRAGDYERGLEDLRSFLRLQEECGDLQDVQKVQRILAAKGVLFEVISSENNH